MPTAAVLYVEDEKYDALFMSKAFDGAGLGASLQVVTDGRQAINYLAGKAGYEDRAKYPLPAVVLLDLKLPLVSGFEVLRWIREQPEFKALPVVIFSSSARDEDRIKARELGANAYMEKPGSLMELPAVVEYLQKRWLGVGDAKARTLASHGGFSQAESLKTMDGNIQRSPAEILLVEDTPSDVRLTLLAFKQNKRGCRVTAVENGVEAMALLRRQGQYARAPRPDLILLDLKLPLKSGFEVLAEIKTDEDLQSIPVVVLTSSPREADVLKAYNIKANAYVIKPVEFEEYLKMVAVLEAFWCSAVNLPPKSAAI
jgi:CheY-like chemotaxis protein